MSAWEWESGQTGRYLVGEVENGASIPMFNIRVGIEMFDSNGRLLATDSGYVDVGTLAPSDRAGFDLSLSPPPGYSYAIARVSADAAHWWPDHQFTVTITNRYAGSGGSEHIVGLVRNDGAAPTSSVWVYGTFFDAEGRPTGQEWDHIDVAVAPGESVGWEFLRTAGQGPYVTSHLFAESPSTATTPAITPQPAPSTPTPPPTRSGGRSGYWMVGASGVVYAFGDAAPLGDPSGRLGTAEAVDIEPTPSGRGYWVVDDRGQVHAFGDALPHGSVDASQLSGREKVTSLSATRSGDGYWIFTSRGRVITFGDAEFLGDVKRLKLAGPVLDSIVTPSGEGYYMVASDGGIFAFGDAAFYGSMGDVRLNAPVQSLVPDPDGVGYWLVASDGGVFAFQAPFRGALGDRKLNKPVTGMVQAGSGYLMVGEDGGIFDFSGAPDGFKGSLGANPPWKPIVSVAVLG